MKQSKLFKTEKDYKEAFRILNEWGKFGFTGRGKFTPARKSAITRRAKQMRNAFLTERTLRRRLGADHRKYDFVKTSGKALKVARLIWGSSLVIGNQGFLIPRGNGVTKGRKTVRVWVDSAGNIRRKVRGSKEVYIPISNNKLVQDELTYLLKLVAPYIVPNATQKNNFPNYNWSTEIKGKHDEFIRWGLLVFGHLGKEMKSLNILISDMAKYLIDAVRNGIHGEENGLEIQGILGIRP